MTRPAYAWSHRGGLLKISRRGDVVLSARGEAANILAARLQAAPPEQVDVLCSLVEIVLGAAAQGQTSVAEAGS